MVRLKSITHVVYIALQEADNVFKHRASRSVFYVSFSGLAAPRQVQAAGSRLNASGPGVRGRSWDPG